MQMTRPSRHSSRHCPCGARWHATFTGDFRLRGDTRPPTARSVALDVAAESDHARLGRDRFYQTCAPRDCPHDPTGCVAFPDTARLIETRAVSRNPIAVQGEAKMNKNELVSHVAAETSATRANAERMVGAVFSAIGDALARDEPVAIAASRMPSFKAAKALRDAVNG